jgi:hypothetical protein
MSYVGHPIEQIPNTILVFPLDQSAYPVSKISNQILFGNLTTKTASITSGTRVSLIKTASNVRSRGSSVITVIRLLGGKTGVDSRQRY